MSYLKSLITSLVIKLFLVSSLCLAGEPKCADNYEYLNSLLDKSQEKSTQVAGTSKLLIAKQSESLHRIQVIEGQQLSPLELKKISLLELNCKKQLSDKIKDK
ncbi:hypothetical protein CXF71_18740 [Colwellia sp. 12G3]|nr:hypothetical protein CXF71_18740 [Colwellia sp. 12G3]